MEFGVHVRVIGLVRKMISNTTTPTEYRSVPSGKTAKVSSRHDMEEVGPGY